MPFETFAVKVDIIPYVLSGLLLAAGGFMGWWAHRWYERLGRRASERAPLSTGPSDKAGAAGRAGTLHESATQTAPKMPEEWDGSPLRPNLNRQVNLTKGMR